MAKEWTVVVDGAVRHIWECREEDCVDHQSAVVTPDFYQENGEPVCGTCDHIMSYVRTEVLIEVPR